jgi:hypothetical protein
VTADVGAVAFNVSVNPSVGIRGLVGLLDGSRAGLNRIMTQASQFVLPERLKVSDAPNPTGREVATDPDSDS